MSKKHNRRAKAAPVASPVSTPGIPADVPETASQAFDELPTQPVEPPAQAVEPEAVATVDVPAIAAEPPRSGARKRDTAASANGHDSAASQALRHDAHADIRGVLIQLAGARLLLPNATIAEVLSYAPPEPVEAAPEWLLGRIRWRGWQLPLVAFAELAGVGKEPAGLGSKVVVLKALGGNAKAPYFAILSQGFPRLVTVSEQGLEADTDSDGLPLGVHSRVIMNEDTAFVPDLGAVEAMITHALAEAA